jgi:Tfp pilus assembly protein PilO
VKANRQQLILVIGLVALGVVVAVAGVLLAVLPQRSHVRKLDAQIATAQTKLATLRAESHHGPLIRAAQLYQLARAMPNNTDMPGLILDLSRAAQDSRVTLLSVGPGQAIVQPDGSSGLPLKVTISGSWNDITAFLHALRSNVRVNGGKLSVDGRMFTVDNVGLAPNAATAGAPAPGTSGTPGVATGPKGELTATLSVNAFSYGVPPLPTVTTTTNGTTTTSTTPSSSGSVSAAGSTG